MIETKLSLPERRRASKAYVALVGTTPRHSGNAVGGAACVAARPSDATSPEIGSLPINALALALALKSSIPSENPDYPAGLPETGSDGST